MSDPLTLNVRLQSGLADHVRARLGVNGLYENASEYVRGLIRRDKAALDEANFEAVAAEVRRAFETDESDYVEMTAADVIRRGRERRSRHT